MKKLERYAKQMLLDFEIKEDLFLINSQTLKILDLDVNYFDSEFEWNIKTEDDLDGWVYYFMGRWYIQMAHEDVTLTELKNIGKAKQNVLIDSFLGIHSGYEMLNGVGMYSDWIKKAKFLGIKNLGICEKHTLSGIIDFQSQCENNDIKSIFGMTVAIINKNEKDFLVKCYVKNFVGWQNLLKFNKIIQVDEQAYIKQEFFENNCDGLFIVMDPKTMDFKDVLTVSNLYQLDTVSFTSEEKDEWYLNNLEKFMISELEPVLLTDAYYIEKQDWHSREIAWGVGKIYDDKSKNQYFKNGDQYARELALLFSSGNKSWVKLFHKAKNNLDNIVEKCNFKYDVSSRHLPKYKMSKKESEKFDSNEELFLHLIKKGFERVKVEDRQFYIDRLKMEIDVLKKGDVIDYFLVLYDIIQFAKRENILVGIGRGSAGGSLVSYLLELIYVNPIEFNLLFERFLNEGRMGTVSECEAYEIETDDGKKITLNEKSLIKILRNEEEMPIFVEDLKEGDEIIKI